MGVDKKMIRDAALASAVFIVWGGLTVWLADLAWGWVMVGFGLIGWLGITARVMGWFDGMDARIAAKNRAKVAVLQKQTIDPVTKSGDTPVLSPARQKKVREAVTIMAEYGLFAPLVPDPVHLFEGVADYGGPVTPDGILLAMIEADYYHPAYNPGAHNANLALHETQVEQFEDHLAEQIASMAKLSCGALDVRDVRIHQAPPRDGDGIISTQICMSVNGETVALTYFGWAKYLSTELHHALATRYAALGTGKRYAWGWVDQGAFISVLPEGAVEQLNTALKLKKNAAFRWDWIDESVPFSAEG